MGLGKLVRERDVDEVAGDSDVIRPLLCEVGRQLIQDLSAMNL